MRLTGQNWQLKCGRETHSSIHHPYYDLPQAALTKIRNFLTLQVPEEVYEVNCHYELRTATNSTTHKRDIFCCNPNYRSKPWFDWANIRYEIRRSQSRVRYCDVPARVYLWMSYGPYTKGKNCPDNIFALIHPLSSMDLPSYPFLPFFKADKLTNNEFEIVNFDTSISSVAFMLPAACTDAMKARVAPKGIICDNEQDNTYFISLPPQSEWLNLGWPMQPQNDNVLQNETEEQRNRQVDKYFV